MTAEALPRSKVEGSLHAHGKPLSGRCVNAEQATIPGFGATYREALHDVERRRYEDRRDRVARANASLIDAGLAVGAALNKKRHAGAEAHLMTALLKACAEAYRAHHAGEESSP